MKSKVTINKVLLGDSLGELADQITEGGFNPEAIIIIGIRNDDLRLRHTCRNFAELLGVLVAACESVRIKE